MGSHLGGNQAIAHTKCSWQVYGSMLDTRESTLHVRVGEMSSLGEVQYKLTVGSSPHPRGLGLGRLLRFVLCRPLGLYLGAFCQVGFECTLDTNPISPHVTALTGTTSALWSVGSALTSRGTSPRGRIHPPSLADWAQPLTVSVARALQPTPRDLVRLYVGLSGLGGSLQWPQVWLQSESERERERERERQRERRARVIA